MLLLRSLLVLACLVPLVTAAAPAGLRAGAHAEDITPKTFPAPINGGMKGKFSSTISDPMHARAFALHDGRSAIVLCVVDSCLIPREICESAKAIAAKQTGMPASNILISATHSHSCAAMTPAFQSDPDPAYIASLPARIAQAIIRAHTNLEPAEIAWRKDSDPNHVFNRRWLMKEGKSYENPFGSMGDRARMNPGPLNPDVIRPAGPVDPEVYLLAARAKSDRRPIAVLANYGLHYVGGKAPISADYFAAFADKLGQRLGAGDARYAGKPAFVGIMSNGTSGDVTATDHGAPPVVYNAAGGRIEKVSTSVTNAAMRAWQKLSWQASVPLASRERDISLGVRKATPAELERARQVLASTPRDKDGQYGDRKAIYAREATLLDAYPDKVPVKLQAHRIGSLTIAAIPCEVFAEIGLDLKRNKPLNDHFTISLANGYNGYLPTPEHHRLGGYETWRARSSYLETDASVQITAQLKEMLAELAAR